MTGYRNTPPAEGDAMSERDGQSGSRRLLWWCVNCGAEGELHARPAGPSEAVMEHIAARHSCPGQEPIRLMWDGGARA